MTVEASFEMVFEAIFEAIVEGSSAGASERGVSRCDTITGMSDASALSPETIESYIAAGHLSEAAGKNLQTFLADDSSSPFRDTLASLVGEENFQQLDALFWQVIPFGTGGRRGPMGEFGPATINARTVAESAQGLAVYARNTLGEGGSAVVAYDTRNRSDEFACITAATLAGNGMKVFLFPAPRSTPELSFAVRHLGCQVGVMITASHNPPADNGFKAYWNTGGQVLPPHDAGIIEQVYAVEQLHQVDVEEALADGRIVMLGDDLDEAFLAAVVDLSLSPARDIDGLYSPLHGVGESVCFEVVKRAGFNGVAILGDHREPDGDFPNVPDHFPNPERPEVFEPLFKAARAMKTPAEVILASDPDADRLGVAARTTLNSRPDDGAGEYVKLSGNRVAALLVDYVCEQRNDLTPEHFVVETLVTTPQVARIAQVHNLKVVYRLLVGFKYIGQAMDEHGPDKFVLGCEESLGYLAGQYARDKCAGIATLYLLEAAAVLKAQGKTLHDRLDELAVEHGHFLEDQTSKVCKGSEGAAQIQQLMAALRTQPPSELAGITWLQLEDFEAGVAKALGRESALPGDERTEQPIDSPRGNLLIFTGEIAGATYRMAIRPSGTEPKIKFYLFAESPVSDAALLDGVKAEVQNRIDALKVALDEWLDSVLSSGQPPQAGTDVEGAEAQRGAPIRSS